MVPYSKSLSIVVKAYYNYYNYHNYQISYSYKNKRDKQSYFDKNILCVTWITH